MAWLARKAMNLGGTEVVQGDLVPQRVVDKIPASRFGSLVRVGYLVEASPAQVRATKKTSTVVEEPEPDTTEQTESTNDSESED